jgi:hypothetical protein
MRVSSRTVVVALAALVAPATLSFPSVARADEALLGLRVGYYTGLEKPFAGAELLIPVAHRVYLNPNAEYVFVNNVTYMTWNLDFHYDLPSRSQAFVWIGAGLGVVYQNPSGPPPSTTDLAANFLAGLGLNRGPVIPYFQVKLIAKSDTEASVAFGLRF